MTILKCKMCGGDLSPVKDSNTCECEFCGTLQTIPSLTDDAMQTLFNRANTLRMKANFDKAAEIYEKILQNNETESEAYWGLILCKYGIEYVEDPKTFKRIPTCHRASFEAVTADEDYKNAIRYADSLQRKIYEEEAKAIDEIQRGILAVAQKEDPYDVFICYKETDENGKRTQDSVIANDIYYQLKQEGYKVFYAAISLESKLGTEYEPYIFSALNTAKVMLAIGTKPEYFNAVWVKNEWSRFLKLMKKDRSKLLIPCYRDMDAYELPEEFAHLQAQDMSKIGFINDLVRGIKKVIIKENKTQSKEEAPVYSSNVSALLKRGNIALEDNEWEKADGFFEEVLNQNPESAEAYIGKLLASKKLVTFNQYLDSLKNKYSGIKSSRLYACNEDVNHINSIVNKYSLPLYLAPVDIRNVYNFDRSYKSYLPNYEIQKEELLREMNGERLLTRARQYAKGNTKEALDKSLKVLEEEFDLKIQREEEKDKETIQNIKTRYADFLKTCDEKVISMRKEADRNKERDAQEELERKERKAREEQERKEKLYQDSVNTMNQATDISSYENVISQLKTLTGYKDTKDLIGKCEKEIEKLRIKEQQEKEALAKKKKRNMIIAVAAVVAVIIMAVIFTKVIVPNNKYNQAVNFMNQGDYESAIAEFEELDGYKDSNEQLEKCYSEIYGTDVASKINSINIGDSFSIGEYGNQNIDWLVLAKQGSKLFLITKDGIDCKKYNDTYSTNIAWYNSSLRTWLNDAFYNQAFSEEEQISILETHVEKSGHPTYNINPGYDSDDKIFLLSYQEAKQYFKTDNERICKPSDLAIKNGVNVSNKGSCNWWLRTTGRYNGRTCIVGFDGALGDYGAYVSDNEYAVRPAMWIDISKLK